MSAGLRRSVVVSEFVLIELTNALASVESRGRAIALWPHLQSDPTVTIVPASTELLARGLELYVHRPDKDWSLTDCTSFVVMEERGLTEALTADRHFEQAGYAALLLS
jgi:predicted nucleic acid-binding protein